MEHDTIPLYNTTRWGSSFKMIERGIELKNVLNLWCSESRVEKLSELEWLELRHLHRCLKSFFDLTEFLQGEKYTTIWMVLASYNKLFDCLDEIMEVYPNSATLTKAFSKLKKYYELTNDCPANFIGTILCTKYKLNYFIENEFEDELPYIKKL